MHYNRGYFFPDGFPTPFEAAFATVQRAAVINGVPARALLLAFSPGEGDHRWRHGSVASATIQGLYAPGRPYLANTHFIGSVAQFFAPRVMDKLQYCPLCAADSGYLSLFFHLRCVRWCPWHRIELKSLCAQCADAAAFCPDRNSQPCATCGYAVPSLKVILDSLRSGLCAQRAAHSLRLFSTLARLQRLGILDTMRLGEGPIDPPVLIQPHSFYEAFEEDSTLRRYRVALDMRGGEDSLTQPRQVDVVYRRFVSFWRSRLLRRHRHCLHNANSSLGIRERGSCVFALTLMLFRQKFETLPISNTRICMSDRALECLSELGFTRSSLRNYFKVMFYRLLSRLWYRCAHSNGFSVRVDSRFFFTPFLGRTPSLSDYLGETIRGRVHEIIIDLPAGLPVLRKLMSHGRTDALLRISHAAGTVSVHTDAQPKFLFGFEILASAFVF